MSGQPSDEYDWATDSDPFFVFLGIYVAGFQWIKGKLDEILLLHAGHENWTRTQRQLAGLTNQQRVAAVARAAVDAARFPRLGAHREWSARVGLLVESLDKERTRRNAILHSQYWLRGLESGLSAIRTDKKRNSGEMKFNTEEMTRDRMNSILKEIAILSFDVGQLHLQLIHWTAMEPPLDEKARTEH